MYTVTSRPERTSSNEVSAPVSTHPPCFDLGTPWPAAAPASTHAAKATSNLAVIEFSWSGLEANSSPAQG